MGDDPTNGAPDEPIFSKRPEKREFLKNNSRNLKGETLFAKMNFPYPFTVEGWEWYTAEGQDKQIALILSEKLGREFLFPLGSSSEWIISDAGINTPDDMIGGSIMIELYETGSTGKFAQGKRITAINLP